MSIRLLSLSRRQLSSYLLMTPTSSRAPSPASSTGSYKRSFSQSESASNPSPSVSTRPFPRSSHPNPTSRNEPSGSSKRPKVQRNNDDTRRSSKTSNDMPPKASGSQGSASRSDTSRWQRGRSSSFRGGSAGRRPSSSAKPKGPNLPALSLPLQDMACINQTYNPTGEFSLKPQWTENPKAPLTNYVMAMTEKAPVYACQEGLANSTKMWRCTVVADAERGITGVGDAPSRKEAEKIAALSACLQLSRLGLLVKPKPVVAPPSPLTGKLTDGTEITFERARQFMGYYCRRYRFPKPDINFALGDGKHTQQWQATMVVGGRQIGIGSAGNKKHAEIACYIDVCQYLESCDPKLWMEFVEKYPSVDSQLPSNLLFTASDEIHDSIRDLCTDIKGSTLYANRPRSKAAPRGLGDDLSGQRPGGFPRQSLPFTPEAHKIKSARLLEIQNAYLANPQLEAMRTQRASLPVSTYAQEILSQLDKEDVIICMAATGSGKTTQIPQIIFDDWIKRGDGSKCNILCTQPRRIAAISVAQRVANERGEQLGRSIGYQVRFEAKYPQDHGSVLFCTTGIFLKRMQSALAGQERRSNATNMDDVTHIIVDEVHERDVDTDLALVVLKRLLADRKARGKPIKVVLMSATIDPSLFQQYFADVQGHPAKVVEVPGRTFPVERRYMDDIMEEIGPRHTLGRTGWVFKDKGVVDYLNTEVGPGTVEVAGHYRNHSRSPTATTAAPAEEEQPIPYPLVALTIAHVLKQSDSGHVLVFLPGWEEITAVQKILVDNKQYPLFDLDFNDTDKFSIHLLHSSIPIAEQQVVFEPAKPGVRRIVLATNIAETSITIPDVVYVVDTGKVKEKQYDPERHMSSLVSAWVGTSNLNQRAGRAGRHRPGQYYGIMSRSRLESLHTYQLVEMKRVDLTNVVMHVKALNFPQMEVEEVLAATIEPPAPGRVEAAMKSLKMVGALDDDQNLTSLGRVLLQLPVDVAMGRLVLYGSFFKCLDQALTLAAILTNRDPFMAPLQHKEAANSIKNSWSPAEFRSDALAILFAYNQWWEKQSRGHFSAANQFCSDNFLSKATLLTIQRIKEQLLQSLYHAGVIEVSAGGALGLGGDRAPRGLVVPPALNTNGDSLPLLAALIAIASQPNFAVRTSDKVYKTAQDRVTFIHPGSVNHRKRIEPEGSSHMEKQLFAFVEKSRNVSNLSGGTPQTYLRTSTRLDPMTYMLFGAYNIEDTQRGLECDNWLSISGHTDTLDDISRLKGYMEAVMLRVFEGIGKKHRHSSRAQARPGIYRPPAQRLHEADTPINSDDEDDSASPVDKALSPREVSELDSFTRDIVRILDRYSEERLSTQSRRNSRPATPMGGYSPMGSPGSASIRLPPFTRSMLGGHNSGYSTPYNAGSAYNSRPSTPSGLSRGFFS